LGLRQFLEHHLEPVPNALNYIGQESSKDLALWRLRLKMIRKLKSGKYRLYARKVDPKTGKRRNLGTFPTRKAAEKHEQEVQFFKRRGGRG
jgi:hypothetical protein